MLDKLLKVNNSFNLKCPSCGEVNRIRRSHSRNIREKFFNHFTFYKIYRCKNCGWRGYLINIRFGISTLKVVLIYIMIAVIVGFITYQIISRLS